MEPAVKTESHTVPDPGVSEIIDTHLHIWDTSRLRYPWLKDAGPINRPFTILDYGEVIRDFPVVGMVFLQCDCDPAQRSEEIAFVKASSQVDARLQGIVPYCPLEKGAAIFSELETLGADPQIKGIRRILQGEPDDAYCLRPGFVQAVKRLAEVDLHFEICIYHKQMAAAIELARLCPNVRFILDHIGKPDIKAHLLSPWREQIQTLAGLPNVWCKVSGMVTEADKDHWTIEDLRPYAETVFDAFGFDRVLFGGDWPVVTLASSLPRWIETLYALVDGCSAKDKSRLFSTNARAFYRL